MKKPSGLQLGVYAVSALLIAVGLYAIIWPFEGLLSYNSTWRTPGSGAYRVSKELARVFGVVSLLFGLGLIYFLRGDRENR